MNLRWLSRGCKTLSRSSQSESSPRLPAESEAKTAVADSIAFPTIAPCAAERPDPKIPHSGDDTPSPLHKYQHGVAADVRSMFRSLLMFSAQNSRRHHSGFRPEIEGMRGIAVLLVVLFHCGVAYFGGGFVGVDVFFALSGYLITGLILNEIARNGSLSYRNFYARRARRLLSAAGFMVVG